LKSNEGRLSYDVARSFDREGRVSGISLFRPEVAQARRGEWLGTIIVAAPPSRWVMTVLALSRLWPCYCFFFCQCTRRPDIGASLSEKI
jgi:hypothetical protein